MEYERLSEFVSEDEGDEVEAPLLIDLAERVNVDPKLPTLSSFTFMEIMEIWKIVKWSILSDSTRGERPKYSPMDRLLLLLKFLKHGLTFNKFGLEYGLDSGTTCSMIHRMLDLVCKPLQSHQMEYRTMIEIVKIGKLRVNHPGIKIICDVLSNRPTGTFF
jgi:hypothetical protein